MPYSICNYFNYRPLVRFPHIGSIENAARNGSPVACSYGKLMSDLKLNFVGLQPTVIASRAPHLLLEQSVKIQRIVDVRRPSTSRMKISDTEFDAD